VRGWGDTLVLAAFAASAVALTFFVAWELHVAEPMLDMRFFRNPRFTAANSAITMTFFALFGSMFLMTQYWQLVHGYSPLGAGVRLIPYALTMMVTAPLSARLVERIGTKRVITTGLLVVASALLTLSFIHATTPYPRVIAVFCVMAVGMGLTMAPATESVMGSLPRHKAGVGSAVNDTTRQVGGALGVAIIGSIVTSVYAERSSDVAGRFGISGSDASAVRSSLRNALDVAATLPERAGSVFQGEVKDAFVGSLVNGLRLSAVVILAAAFIVWRFLPARAHDHAVAVDRSVGDPAIAVSAGGG
jgi:predicted MFS family arabinose efflux permease